MLCSLLFILAQCDSRAPDLAGIRKLVVALAAMGRITCF